MRGPHDPRVYLRDILDAAQDAQDFVAELSREQFEQDRKSGFAVARALEILGEATKRIPDAIRELDPEIPWNRMAGMRDVLIHEYVRVDLEVLWQTVQQDLPILRPRIEALLLSLNPDEPD